jgi:hypothetical protein
MSGRERPAEGLTRKDYIRLAIWLPCWVAGFCLLEYAHFAWHNPIGVALYVLGFVALCEKRRARDHAPEE